MIRVPIDPDLLSAINRLSRERGQPRAALILEACRRYVAEESARVLDDTYAQGYSRHPESPAIGAAQVSLVAEVLGPDAW